MKKCGKCLETKSLCEFGTDKRIKSGRSSQCKTCINKAANARGRTNPEKTRLKKLEWGRANPEKTRLSRLKWRHANSEKVSAQYRKWSQDNLEGIRSRHAAYLAELSDSLLASWLARNTCLRPKDIPKELIEAKRDQVLTYRASRQLKQALKQQGDRA